jgi:SAM-dependent MidA family methyltransferase
MEEEKLSPSEGLKRFLLNQIEKKGAIPFVQFMEWCLYNETYGYYQSNPMRIGKEGDYYTIQVQMFTPFWCHDCQTTLSNG